MRWLEAAADPPRPTRWDNNLAVFFEKLLVIIRRPLLVLEGEDIVYSHQKWWKRLRCRLFPSWSCSRGQGWGCSPIKGERELGLEKRLRNELRFHVRTHESDNIRLT